MRTSKVLVVDNERSERATLTELLALEGYDVQSAETGADALALVQAAEFDLVLTELRLSDISGVRVLAETRRRWPDCVSIILTSDTSVDSALAAVREGAYDYLCTPCPSGELLAAVARGLELNRLTRQVKFYVRQLEVSIDTARELYSTLDARLLEATAALAERDQQAVACYQELNSPLLAISSLAHRLHGRLNNPDRASETLRETAHDLNALVLQIQSEADHARGVVCSALQLAQHNLLQHDPLQVEELQLVPELVSEQVELNSA